MKGLTRKAVVIALIAGVLVLCDGIFANILNQTASFTWVAFVSWTVFYGATTKERLKAIIGYVIGFVLAVAIIKLGNVLNFIQASIFGVALETLLATMIINFFCVEMEAFNKYVPISTSGIFVGIAMTFSGLGINLSIDTLESSLLILAIIVIYGILGLLCGWATLKFAIKDN